MENGFERIIAKLKEYEQNHRKLILLERKELIVKNYENLTFELEMRQSFLYGKKKTLSILLLQQILY